MKLPTILGLSLLLLASREGVLSADDAIPIQINSDEARDHVGENVEVVFEVLASKHSAHRMTVFLDSTSDFRDERNLGIAITQEGIESLKNERGVAAPAEHYLNQRIRVVGVVVLRDDRVYIDVTDAEQLDLAPADSDESP